MIALLIGVSIYLLAVNASLRLIHRCMKREFEAAAFQDPIAIGAELQLFFQSQIDDGSLYERSLFGAMQEAFQRGESIPAGKAGNWIKAQWILHESVAEWKHAREADGLNTIIDRLLKHLPPVTRMSLIGDIQEVYTAITSQHGRTWANLWYSMQISIAIASGVSHHFRRLSGIELFELAELYFKPRRR